MPQAIPAIAGIATAVAAGASTAATIKGMAEGSPETGGGSIAPLTPITPGESEAFTPPGLLPADGGEGVGLNPDQLQITLDREDQLRRGQGLA